LLRNRTEIGKFMAWRDSRQDAQQARNGKRHPGA